MSTTGADAFGDPAHAASLALAAGADLKAVQALLGHSTITLTADTYTDILPGLTSEIAENTARLIPRARTPPPLPEEHHQGLNPPAPRT